MKPLFFTPKINIFRLLFFTSFLSLCSCQNIWSEFQPLTFPRSTSIQLQPQKVSVGSSMLTGISWTEATVTPDDKIFTPNEFFDPISSLWTALTPPSLVMGVSQVTLQNGDMLQVAVGPFGSHPTATYIFSPTNLTWRRVGDLNHGKHYPFVRNLKDGRVILVGGKIATSWGSSSVEIFDPQTELWTAVASLNVVRDHPGVEVLDNGKVLVCGGGDGVSSNKLISCELYDPDLNSWTFTGNMVNPRQYMDFIKLDDGRVLAAGGDVNVLPGVTIQTELYDPVSGTWSLTGNLNVARTYCAISKLSDGRVMVAGGYDWRVSWSEKLNSIEIFDPQTGAWQLLSVTLTYKKTDKPKILELSDGRILIAGGYADAVGDTEVDILSNVHQEVDLTPTGGDGHYSYLLVSGPGKVSGNSYSVGVAGTAVIKIKDRSGNELDVVLRVLP